MRSDPLPLEPIAQALETAPRGSFFYLRDRLIALDPLVRMPSGLIVAGRTDIHSPWPDPDIDFQGSGPIWALPSPERQLERVAAVYEAALRTYSELVQLWLPRFAPRLRMSAICPARLIGRFSTGEAAGWSPPILDWHLEPLSPAEKSVVDIRPMDSGPLDDLRVIHHRLVRYRPTAAGWLSATRHNSSVADVFQQDPLCDLVHNWILGDLREVSWA